MNLPKHMTMRVLKRGRTLFYYQRGGKKIPIGDNIQQARIEWARLENGVGSNLFPSVAGAYKLSELHKKAPKTQVEQDRQLERLKVAFSSFNIDQIKPLDVRRYLDRRTKKISGNREIALLSHLWNWARQRGITDLANPCIGVARNREQSRKVYVRTEAYERVYNEAVFWLQDAMDLILDAGQRPSDILKATKHDLNDGLLEFLQGKTGTRVRVEVTGRLKMTIDRILGRERKVQTIYLVADDRGQRISIWKLDKEFAKARARVGETWQIRDLRKKSATDETDLRTAQERLGHADETTTARMYRQVRGNRVRPLR